MTKPRGCEYRDDLIGTDVVEGCGKSRPAEGFISEVKNERRRARVADHLRIVLAGIGGGVGTTTIAALLFAELAPSPALIDHSGGDLGARLTGGDDASQIDDSLALHDLGPDAGGELVDLLRATEIFGLVVIPTTSAGFALAHRTLADIRDSYGSGGLRRALVAAVGVFGNHRAARARETLHNEFGQRTLVVFPQDAALAAGGRVPLNRVSPETRAAQKTLAGYVRERMRAFSN